MKLKRIIFGEEIPDKDDPRYKEKHEKTKEAGMKFAQKLRLDKMAAHVQGFATENPRLFLAIIFAFVLFSVGLNLYRLRTAVVVKNEPSSVIERQEKELHFNRHGRHTLQQYERHKNEQQEKPTEPHKQLEQYECYQ